MNCSQWLELIGDYFKSGKPLGKIREIIIETAIVTIPVPCAPTVEDPLNYMLPFPPNGQLVHGVSLLACVDDYLQLWVKLAITLHKESIETIRDIFGTWIQNFPILEKNAYLYFTWSYIEKSRGSMEKVNQILNRGMKCGANPVIILDKTLKKISALRSQTEVKENKRPIAVMGNTKDKRPVASKPNVPRFGTMGRFSVGRVPLAEINNNPILSENSKLTLKDEPEEKKENNSIKESPKPLPEINIISNPSVSQSLSTDSDQSSPLSTSELIPTKNNKSPFKWIENIEYVNSKPYLRLNLIGKGGSSRVYKILSSDQSMYALKQVNTADIDSVSRNQYLEEIKLLERLQSYPCIITMMDKEVTSTHINIILECGEIDLAGVLSRYKEGLVNHKTYLQLYWEQILEAVSVIHQERIVHGDLKPQNFVMVKGILKLIDFGIAKAIHGNTTNIERDNITGTLQYLAPETRRCTQQGTSKSGRMCGLWGVSYIRWSMENLLYLKKAS